MPSVCYGHVALQENCHTSTLTTMLMSAAMSTITLLPVPPAARIDPAPRLSTLWAYILPALDLIIHSSWDDTRINYRVSPISMEYRMGVHIYCYNYLTAHSKENPSKMRGRDLYKEIDTFYADIARELVLHIPDDHMAIIHYVLSTFDRYHAAAIAIQRLLHAINSHYVDFTPNEDKWWHGIGNSIARATKETYPPQRRSQKDMVAKELKRWGYKDGGSAELLAQARACAEAASSPGRIIPLLSLAMRRFRTDFVEPILGVPMTRVNRDKDKPVLDADGPFAPKDRLVHAIRELLKGDAGAKNLQLVAQLDAMLNTVGIRAHHPLRKKLRKLVQISDAS